MSGSPFPPPTVALHGPYMASIIAAIPIAERMTGRQVIVIGGLAVLCRLSTPYRATTDLDTVTRRQEGQVGQLELLLAAGSTPSGPAGAQVVTPLGFVQVDVLEVAETDLNPLPEDATDRLYVLAHAWAVDTAGMVSLVVDDRDPVDVLVAQPAALVAMKLQSAMNRGATKEATDLLDIIRLVTDPVTATAVVEGLQQADRQLRQDALLHGRHWFVDGMDLTLRKVRRIPEGAQMTTDDLRLVAGLLTAALES